MKNKANVILSVLLAVCICAASYMGVSNANSMKAMSAEIAVLNDQLNVAEADAAEKSEEISVLNAESTEKDDTIAALSADADIREAQIAALTAESAEKDDAIAALSADADVKEAQIAALTAESAEKDDAIAALSADADVKEAQIAALTTESTEKDDTIAVLSADADVKEAQIAALTAESTEKDDTIAALSADIETKATQITNLSNSLMAALADIEAGAGTAENLSGISEGTCDNTKRFIKILQEKGIKYTYEAPSSSITEDHVRVRYELKSDKGRSFTVALNFYIDPKSDYIECFVWNFYNYKNFDSALAACTACTGSKRYIQAYIDTSDDSITLYHAEHATDDADFGIRAYQMLRSYISAMESVYDLFYENC